MHVASRNDRHPLSSGEAHEPHKAQPANRATPEGVWLNSTVPAMQCQCTRVGFKVVRRHSVWSQG